jgi:hypothetical protein
MKAEAPKQKFTLRRILKFALLLGVVILLLYLLVYRPYEVRKDRQRYKQAEASIKVQASSIEKLSRKPDVIEKNESCSYASRKYIQGPLSCNVSVSYVYAITENVEANQIVALVKQSVDSNTRFTKKSGELKILSPLESRSVQEFGIDYSEKTSGLSCILGFEYRHFDTSISRIKSSKTDQNLIAEFTCGGPAKAEFYPLED